MHPPVRRAWRRRPALPVRRRRACRCPAGRTAPGAGALSTRELLHSLACHHYASRDGADCCHAQCSAMQAAARNSSSVPRACTWAGAQAAGARTERKGQVSFTVRSSVAVWRECISAHLYSCEPVRPAAPARVFWGRPVLTEAVVLGRSGWVEDCFEDAAGCPRAPP